MSERVLKVFGERNTGTRAVIRMTRDLPDVVRRIQSAETKSADDLEHAIATALTGHWRRAYLHALRDDVSRTNAPDDLWKHAVPRLTPGMIGAGAATLIMVRNPYSWLTALARRPYHMKGPPAASLLAFAQRPWMTEPREGLPAVVPSPVDLWSRKVRAALDCRTSSFTAGIPCEILRFEDFIQAPAASLGEILTRMDFSTRGLVNLSRNTKPGEPDLDDLRHYYRAERWREDYCAAAIAAVNEQVDWNVAAALGYRKLDPADFPDLLPTHAVARFERETAGLTVPSHRKAGAATAA